MAHHDTKAVNTDPRPELIPPEHRTWEQAPWEDPVTIREDQGYVFVTGILNEGEWLTYEGAWKSDLSYMR